MLLVYPDLASLNSYQDDCKVSPHRGICPPNPSFPFLRESTVPTVESCFLQAVGCKSNDFAIAPQGDAESLAGQSHPESFGPAKADSDVPAKRLPLREGRRENQGGGTIKPPHPGAGSPGFPLSGGSWVRGGFGQGKRLCTDPGTPYQESTSEFHARPSRSLSQASRTKLWG